MVWVETEALQRKIALPADTASRAWSSNEGLDAPRDRNGVTLVLEVKELAGGCTGRGGTARAGFTPPDWQALYG